MCLAIGFFIGIVYENILAEQKLIMADLFLKSNLELYLQTQVVTKKYVIYVLRERLILFAGLAILGCIKWKKIVSMLLLVIGGFFVGVATVASVLQLGIKGILLCIVGILPQGVFYGMLAYLMLNYWFKYPNLSWNRAKSVFVIVMFLMGVLTEAYVNPALLKWMLKIIF